MLRRPDNRYSVCLANIGSGERRRHDLLAISLNNKAHAVVDHRDLDVPSTLFESSAVPGSRQDDVVSGIFFPANGIEALGFGQGSSIS
jgi:hypothetical protein